jgi:hypothetical protein
LRMAIFMVLGRAAKFNMGTRDPVVASICDKYGGLFMVLYSISILRSRAPQISAFF